MVDSVTPERRAGRGTGQPRDAARCLNSRAQTRHLKTSNSPRHTLSAVQSPHPKHCKRGGKKSGSSSVSLGFFFCARCQLFYFARDRDMSMLRVCG